MSHICVSRIFCFPSFIEARKKHFSRFCEIFHQYNTSNTFYKSFDFQPDFLIYHLRVLVSKQKQNKPIICHATFFIFYIVFTLFIFCYKHTLSDIKNYIYFIFYGFENIDFTGIFRTEKKELFVGNIALGCA